MGDVMRGTELASLITYTVSAACAFAAIPITPWTHTWAIAGVSLASYVVVVGIGIVSIMGRRVSPVMLVASALPPVSVGLGTSLVRFRADGFRQYADRLLKDMPSTYGAPATSFEPIRQFAASRAHASAAALEPAIVGLMTSGALFVLVGLCLVLANRSHLARRNGLIDVARSDLVSQVATVCALALATVVLFALTMNYSGAGVATTIAETNAGRIGVFVATMVAFVLSLLLATDLRRLPYLGKDEGATRWNTLLAVPVTIGLAALCFCAASTFMSEMVQCARGEPPHENTFQTIQFSRALAPDNSVIGIYAGELERTSEHFNWVAVMMMPLVTLVTSLIRKAGIRAREWLLRCVSLGSVLLVLVLLLEVFGVGTARFREANDGLWALKSARSAAEERQFGFPPLSR